MLVIGIIFDLLICDIIEWMKVNVDCVFCWFDDGIKDINLVLVNFVFSIFVVLLIDLKV